MSNKRALLIYQNEKFPYAFEAAANNGYDIVFIHKPLEPYTQCYKNVIYSESIDIFKDEENSLSELTKLIKDLDIECIITYRDEAIPFTAKLASRNKIPYVSQKNADDLRSKWKMRELTSHLSCTPSSKVLREIKDIEKSSEFYPCIIKPASGFGSMGVTLANNYEEAVSAYHKILDINSKVLEDFKNSEGEDITDVLQEQYIPGEEFIVDSFSLEGKHKILSIASKGESSGPYFEESYHATNPHLKDNVLQKIIDATIETLNAINFSNGPTHCELKVYQDNVYIIEIGARIGGGSICHYLVMEGTGIDYTKLIFDMCKSDRSYFDSLPDTPVYKCSALNYNIKVGKEGGIFKRINNLKALALDKRVKRVLRVMKEGVNVKPYPEFVGFPGFIQSSHMTFQESLEFTHYLERNITVEYEKRT
jgi:predicted ATP-grasp superfamily ATP-dependent carboligase